MAGRVARVAVDKASLSFDKLFDYLIPDSLRQIAKGCRVMVPFGRSNRLRQAIVIEVTDQPEVEKLKPVFALLDPEPLLNQDMFDLMDYLRENTFCTYYEAVRAILPRGLQVHTEPVYSLSKDFTQDKFDQCTEEEQNLLRFLREAPSAVSMDAFLQTDSREGSTDKKKVIAALLEKGAIIYTEALRREVNDKTIRMVQLCEGVDLDNQKLSKKQKDVISFLEQSGCASVKETCYLCGVTEAVIKTLEKYGIVAYYERETYRALRTVQKVQEEELKTLVLSPEQEKVFTGILSQYREATPSVALLHGVTGSGKTQIFLKLIEQVIAEGRQALMLVPEISLTPQMVQKFQALFGKNVAVIHSSLSLGERLDEWKRIRSGEAKIVVGTRSAVFSPCRNIGLIIMDEEGEQSYKSDASPRYHAREVAKLRCVKHRALLLLASATPSIESYYYATTGKYSLYTLHHRYAGAALPEVYMTDLRAEAKQGQDIVLSEVLARELHANLERGEQSILLLNRRGYNTYAACMDCGEVMECPNCSVPLTYHKVNHSLLCHYCGYIQPYGGTCPACGGSHIRLSGLGTQRIEDILAQYFPEARILRMDTDTTYSRFAYEKNFADFANGDYDILVGTQMVAKGLNFPNVTLVGVLSADNTLYGGDFRCMERTFSLITQVVGRSGRGDKPGRAYIQTYTPDHPVLQFAAHQNYRDFYQDEIQSRKALLFPPFCDICVVGFNGMDEVQTEKAAGIFMQTLHRAAERQKETIPMKAMGPSRAGIYKLNNRYRYRIVIKCRAGKRFKQLLGETLRQVLKQKSFADVTVFADINGEIGV